MLHLKHFTAEEKQNSLGSRSTDILPQRARRSQRNTIIGLRTKATYCQGQRHFTAEGAEESRKRKSSVLSSQLSDRSWRRNLCPTLRIRIRRSSVTSGLAPNVRDVSTVIPAQAGIQANGGSAHILLPKGDRQLFPSRLA